MKWPKDEREISEECTMIRTEHEWKQTHVVKFKRSKNENIINLIFNVDAVIAVVKYQQNLN